MMSDNKRDLMKITIEGSHTQVLECHGFAGLTLEDAGDCHKTDVALIGNLNLRDLIALHDNIEKELLPTLKRQIANDYLKANSPDDVLKALLGLGDE